MEIIAVTDSGDLIILDYNERRVQKRINLKGSLYGVLVNDLDNDRINEIIVCLENAMVYCLNPIGHIKWKFKTNDSVYSMHCYDLDKNRDSELLLGTRDNTIYVLDSQGNFKWKYHTEHNVRSIFIGQISHLDFFDLFVGLDNKKVYCYKLVDPIKTRAKIERSYQDLLKKTKDEFSYLVMMSHESDEYHRQFSIEKMKHFSHNERLIFKILSILFRVLEDESSFVRSAGIKTLIDLMEYDQETVQNLLLKLSHEKSDNVRNALIESISLYYFRSNKNKIKNALLDTLTLLYESWEKLSPVLESNLYTHAKESFDTGDYKGAFNDFELLYKRGLDFIWKEKTKGFGCCLRTADIDSDGFNEIILTTTKNLYVFNHIGKKEEIVAGTLDGHLFVLDRRGNLIWRWKAQDDIESIICVEFLDKA